MSEPSIRLTRLANGLTVVSEDMPQIATASVGVWIGAGARHEREDEHGLCHLIEHMAFKGTTRRSARDIAVEIESVGGDINAATSVEYTLYTARTLGEDLPLALDILGDILVNSTFSPAELERERNVILQEIAGVEDAPDDLVNDLFLEAAFPGQALGRPILGRPETVTRFGPADIRAFMGRRYAPSRMVLAAAGAVDHDAVVEAAHRLFGGLAVPEPEDDAPAHYAGGDIRLERDLEQANVMIGFPGLSFRAPEHYALQIFAQVLGGGLSSRLWQEVRETRGLAYAVDAFHWPFSDCGVFGVGGGTAEDDVAEFASLCLDTLEAAARDADAVEVARAKAQMKVGLLSSLETSGGRIDRLARQILAWGRIIPAHEIVQRIDAVDVDAVRAAGAALLKGAPTVAAIGPIGGLPKALRPRTA